jgi:hypothetical protein
MFGELDTDFDGKITYPEFLEVPTQQLKASYTSS